MPRVGQNPGKFDRKSAKPERVLVAVLSYIPFLGGYYRDSLQVLEVCLHSLIENTNRAFDLMVFDNGSCGEVRSYLQSLRDANLVQYLVLAEKNLGKVGAWNFIFGAAQSEYVVYADSDVYFFPDWLPSHLEVFESFPSVGTVTGLPHRAAPTLTQATIDKLDGLNGVKVDSGALIPEEWIRQHARSIGKMDAIEAELAHTDYRLTARNGLRAYVTAQHYQFMVKRELVQQLIPFAYEGPMGVDVGEFDRAIDDSGLLRLAVAERTVLHLGNHLDDQDFALIGGSKPARPGTQRIKRGARRWYIRLLEWGPIKAVLLGIYDRIFRLYYRATH